MMMCWMSPDGRLKCFPHEHVHFEVEMELDDVVDAEVVEGALRDLLHLAGV